MEMFWVKGFGVQEWFITLFAFGDAGYVTYILLENLFVRLFSYF